MSWFTKTSQENIDDLEAEFEVFSTDPYTSYTRYVWGTREQVQSQIAGGLQMNKLGIPGWFGIHTGGDEWVAILANDYSRSGPVCEITISDLPEGYYVIEDPDLSIKGKVDSWMIVSRNPIIPPQCVEITREFDTGDIEGDVDWEMA